jgi:hypothetical protein
MQLVGLHSSVAIQLAPMALRQLACRCAEVLMVHSVVCCCRFQNDVERSIADAETKTSQWTLMHRYHKAADIINEVGDPLQTQPPLFCQCTVVCGHIEVLLCVCRHCCTQHSSG